MAGAKVEMGLGTKNAIHGVTLIHQLRGCQRFDSITPHGWAQAGLWLLQRAMLVEDGKESYCSLLVFHLTGFSLKPS